MQNLQSKTMNEAPVMNAAMQETDEAFHFPQGMAGFPDATRFGFIYEGQGDIVCIQSLDQPEAAFLLTPWCSERLGPQPELSAEQAQCLGLEATDEVLWMLVLNPFADKAWVTANLKAPIALNMSNRRGLQCIRINPDLDIRFPWMPQPATAD
ncbi:MAG: flagellar assembly protein FliW [Mariprofundaceae bacterium]